MLNISIKFATKIIKYRNFARNISLKSEEIIQRQKSVVCFNYSSIPAVLSRGKGIYLYDVDGKKYFDYLSGCTSVNQGHCHPKIIEALVKQVSVLHHTSRAFYSDLLVEYAEFVTKLFGYVIANIVYFLIQFISINIFRSF